MKPKRKRPFALITGASSGIGREIARLLAQKGFNLILAARREHRLMDLQEELTSKYHHVVCIEPMDLSIESNCFLLFHKYKAYPITVVINNAGFGKVGRFLEVPLERELSMIKTNITAVHILTKLFARHMDHGSILNVASMAGFQPGPIFSAYSATKAYLINLSLAVNYELKHEKDVHIATLCPGPVRTEFNKTAGSHMALKSISAKTCARIALNGLFNNKDLIIPGFSMKFLYLGSKLSPYCFLLFLEHWIQTKKL